MARVEEASHARVLLLGTAVPKVLSVAVPQLTAAKAASLTLGPAARNQQMILVYF